MNKRIAYINDEGGVSIIFPSPNNGLTIEELAAKDVPQGKEFVIIDASALPDRADRGAYKLSDGVLSICPVKKAKIVDDLAKQELQKESILLKIGLTEDEFRELKKLV